MIKVSLTEFGQQLDRYQDLARTQPVLVSHEGHEQTVVISVQEYRRLTRGDRRVMTLEDFSEEDLAAIEAAAPPPAASAFDHEWVKPSK